MPKKTIQDQVREGQRETKRAQRGLERDRAELDRQEAKLTMNIKKAAKQNDKTTLNILAKQLVRLREQRSRSHALGAQLSGISAQTQLIGTQAKMADSLKTTTQIMGKMNKVPGFF